MQRPRASNALLVATVVVGVALLLWGTLSSRKVARLRAEVAGLKQQMDTMVAREELQTTQRTIDELERRVASLQSEVESVTRAAKVPASAAEESEPLSGLLETLASLADEAKSEGGDKGIAGLLSAIFSGESGKLLADFGAPMMVDMQYSELFEQLNLPPEKEQQVRQIIAEHKKEELDEAMKMLEDGLEHDAAGTIEQNADERLRDKLSRVLTTEEMALWEEYEETMPERMLRQNLDMSLSMFAPGLTPENRQIFRDAVIDEMYAEGTETPGVPETPEAAFETAIDSMLGEYERARARIADQLDEQQLGILDQFIESQEQMFEMSRGMIEGLFGPLSESEQ